MIEAVKIAALLVSFITMAHACLEAQKPRHYQFHALPRPLTQEQVNGKRAARAVLYIFAEDGR